VLQEAFIGISFSLATAATLLLLANAPHGAEHVQHSLSGEALGWVTVKDVALMALFYAAVGTFLYRARATLHLCSADPRRARRKGLPVRLWDFAFYAAFGLAVTSSVRAAGVLAVFSFLIVPVVCATLLGAAGARRMVLAWGMGIAVSTVAAVLSYARDWPMGATIVCVFGVCVAAISAATRMRTLGDLA